MKINYESKLQEFAGKIIVTGKTAFKNLTSSVLSLCMIASMAFTQVTFSQTTGREKTVSTSINGETPRLITSSTGETLFVRLVNKSDDSVEVIRLNDGKRIHIPIAHLSEADRSLIADWKPTPAQSYRPSSVSIAGSPGIQRKSYPSNIGPRYTSGRTGVSGEGRSESVRTYTQSCTGRKVTVIIPCRPCP